MGKCLIPGNVAAVAGAIAQEEPVRFGATRGVQLTINEHGEYRACATDGRIMAIIKGQGAVKDEIGTAGFDIGTEENTAVVGGEVFLKALGQHQNAKHKLYNERSAFFTLGNKRSLVSFSDDKKKEIVISENVEGKYPNVDAVMPNTAPIATVRVNPKMLITLLQIAAVFDPDCAHGLVIEIRPPQSVLVLRSKNGQNQQLTALLVPLTDPSGV